MAQGCSLAFIDHEHVEQAKQLWIELARRCRVEQNPRAEAPGALEERCIRKCRNLLLQHQPVATGERGVGHCRRVGTRVRTGYDRDAVFSSIVDHDRGRTGCTVYSGNSPQINVLLSERLQRHVCECVAADGAEKSHGCTRTRRRERLVGTLAARIRRKRPSSNRLAGPRKASDARDEIEIDRAENDDHSLVITPLTSRMLP